MHERNRNTPVHLCICISVSQTCNFQSNLWTCRSGFTVVMDKHLSKVVPQPDTHWNADVEEEWITANLKRSLYYIYHSPLLSFLCVVCGLIQQLWKAAVYSEDLSLVWAWDIRCPKADEHCALAIAFILQQSSTGSQNSCPKYPEVWKWICQR